MAPHRTVGNYVAGCRCDDCRTAWREYHRAYRVKRVAQGWCCRCSARAVKGHTRCSLHRFEQTAAGKLSVKAAKGMVDSEEIGPTSRVTASPTLTTTTRNGGAAAMAIPHVTTGRA